MLLLWLCISLFFFFLLFHPFSFGIWLFFPRTFTSGLYFVRLIYLIPFFSNLFVFLSNSFPRLLLLILSFLLPFLTSRFIFVLFFLVFLFHIYVFVLVFCYCLMLSSLFLLLPLSQSHAILLSMVFVPGFFTGVWEIAEKQHIAITDTIKHIFYESPYI